MVHRGGGGSTTSCNSGNGTRVGHIYNLFGGRLPISDDVDVFISQASKLLAIDLESDWRFFVQQYDNRSKNSNVRPSWYASSRFPFTITKDDYSAWDESIRSRILNGKNNLAMVVYTFNGTSQSPDKLPLAEKDGLGKIQHLESCNSDNTKELTPSHTQKSTTIADIVTFSANIWGFAGNAKDLTTIEEILQATQRILGQQLDNFSFYAQVFDSASQRPIKAARVLTTTFGSFLVEAAQTRNLEASVNLFVADELFQFEGAMPAGACKDIVFLRLDNREAYWKIPKNLNEQVYGINQLQRDFRRAFQVVLPPWELNRQETFVGNISTGFGGGKLDVQLLKKVKIEYAALLESPDEGNLIYNVTFAALPPKAEIVVSLTGSADFIYSYRGHFPALPQRITELSAKYVNSRLPTHFKIWDSEDYCQESGEHGQRLKYGDSEVERQAIEQWFNFHLEWPFHVVVRPEWATIKVYLDDDVSETSIAWDIEDDSSLRSFKEALEGHFRRSDILQSDIHIYEHDHDRAYIITNETTEDEWRLYIFDWLYSSKLDVFIAEPTTYGM